MAHPPSSAGRAVTSYVPIASYPSRDTATGDRVFALLRARSIEPVAVGSLGTTVSVDAPQADEARRVIEAAIASEGLKVTMVREVVPSER